MNFHDRSYCNALSLNQTGHQVIFAGWVDAGHEGHPGKGRPKMLKKLFARKLA